MFYRNLRCFSWWFAIGSSLLLRRSSNSNVSLYVDLVRNASVVLSERESPNSLGLICGTSAGILFSHNYVQSAILIESILVLVLMDHSNITASPSRSTQVLYQPCRRKLSG